MRSQIPGCARLCVTCPKRHDRAVLFTSDMIQKARNDEDFDAEEIDPLEVDKIDIIKVYGLSDYGNVTDATPHILKADVRRTNAIYGPSLRSHKFPATISLDMIEACTGPRSVRQHWWQRAEKRCGAYMEALDLIDAEYRDDYQKFIG